MRKITDDVKKAKQPLEIEEGSTNYLSNKQLEDYLKVTQHQISPEAEAIIGWLMANNSTYVKELGTGGDNALIDFYNQGVPADESLRDLYKWIGTLKKNGRLLEVPVFQTQEQFDSILNKTAALDDVVLDLDSEKGRNAVAKKYDKLVWKVAQEFKKVSTLDESELYANGLLGLTYAMNDYGKPAKTAERELNEMISKVRKAAEEAGENPDEAEARVRKEAKEGDNKKKLSFLQYAAWRIRWFIMKAIEDESHTVRIPKSVQQNMLHNIDDETEQDIEDALEVVKQKLDWDELEDEDISKLRALMINKADYDKLLKDMKTDKDAFMKLVKEKIKKMPSKRGEIARSYNRSGDSAIGGDEGEGNRVLWDVIGEKQPVNTGIDKEETLLAKKRLMDAIHKKVGDRNFAWIENALKDNDDPTKVDVKELAKKYKVSDSSISTVASKKAIQKLVLSDPELKKLAYAWYEKFEESLHEELENTIDPTKPISLK